MSDEDILNKGGTEENIKQCAEQNGADLTSQDIWLEEFLRRIKDEFYDIKAYSRFDNVMDLHRARSLNALFKNYFRDKIWNWMMDKFKEFEDGLIIQIQKKIAQEELISLGKHWWDGNQLDGDMSDEQHKRMGDEKVIVYIKKAKGSRKEPYLSPTYFKLINPIPEVPAVTYFND